MSVGGRWPARAAPTLKPSRPRRGPPRRGRVPRASSLTRHGDCALAHAWPICSIRSASSRASASRSGKSADSCIPHIASARERIGGLLLATECLMNTDCRNPNGTMYLYTFNSPNCDMPARSGAVCEPRHQPSAGAVAGLTEMSHQRSSVVASAFATDKRALPNDCQSRPNRTDQHRPRFQQSPHFSRFFIAS